MASTIKLPQLAWHGVWDLELPLSDGWQVEVCNMAGYNRPHLKPAEIKDAIVNPIGMPPIREYARGKNEVVILFDDMARVTRVAEIVPYVLEELAVAGIPDSRIRFMAACGCHGAMNRLDFVKKLGEATLSRFPVYNHSPFDNCVYVGTTTSGTKVLINAEVVRCDLKIGIGSIVPHIMTGFGGGSKILLPGVAALETIEAFHRPREATREQGFGGTVTGMGVFEDNPRRRDIDEAAAMVQLDVKIDAIVNMWGENVAIFAGAPGPAYIAGLDEARTHYLSPAAEDEDIVIANTFAKANESVSGLVPTFSAVSRRGGDVVLIANAPEGQITHYLVGPFGKTIGGPLRLQIKPPPNVNHLIIFSEYPEIASRGYLEETEKVLLMYQWSDVLQVLREHHGNDARVAVYPNADIQYCAINN